MDGIIIFADDDVLNPRTFEGKLYKKLKSDETLPKVLPICDLETLETTVKSMSTFRVLILDWEFKKDDGSRNDESHEDSSEVDLSSSTPETFLKSVPIYSLVYVYSQRPLEEYRRRKLKKLFRDKITFRKKSIPRDRSRISDKKINAKVNRDAKRIREDIEKFKMQNRHMEIPFKWSQAINQSMQKIFIELEQASHQWIKEVYNTAKDGGNDPASEVINTFGHLLNEALIQDNDLRKSLRENFGASGDDSTEQDVATMEENTAKLYRRIFYSKVAKETPITTGDIFELDNNEYGILITPECNLVRGSRTYALLVVDKTKSINFKKNQEKKCAQKKECIKAGQCTEKEEENIFNNGVISRHCLPSFPFNENKYDNLALIEFRTALRVYNKKGDLNREKRKYRLNVPYIHQLRQRFVSYLGRYGTPDIPESLQNFNLKTHSSPPNSTEKVNPLNRRCSAPSRQQSKIS